MRKDYTATLLRDRTGRSIGKRLAIWAFQAKGLVVGFLESDFVRLIAAPTGRCRKGLPVVFKEEA